MEPIRFYRIIAETSHLAKRRCMSGNTKEKGLYRYSKTLARQILLPELALGTQFYSALPSFYALGVEPSFGQEMRVK
ncbi:uncharacterized protein N7506_011760 [Penicillium brevicompactum]|uniref:uncharacterized protein n=1 Tax=Penicillium brevicompactum TaxID=5074 RepID=UPI0025406874|nr:uncharacterized protein N7506_011760 [Penicillium brevicompactum]KAJ5319056.1 hypothetical protein N7506_011760 [Penicillium brevicompactum]